MMKLFVALLQCPEAQPHPVSERSERSLVGQAACVHHPFTAAKWRADSGMECPGVACANCVISRTGARWGELP